MPRTARLQAKMQKCKIYFWYLTLFVHYVSRLFPLPNVHKKHLSFAEICSKLQ